MENIPFLPDNIIYTILLHVPVKYILRCKLVCKSWSSIISTRNFVKTHLYLSTTDPDYTHHRLILSKRPYVPQFYPRFSKLSTCSLPFLLKDNLTRSMRDKPFIDAVEGQVSHIVGSCNGLVCLTDIGQGNVIFWNPSTRKSRRLPKVSEDPVPYGFVCSYGFYYDKFTDDFKVLALFGYDEYKVSMYSSKSDSWRMIGDFPFEIVCPADVKSTDRAMYWVVDLIHDSIVISFDLKSQTYQQLMLPIPEQGKSSLTFDTFDNSPSILYQYETHADFWVIKESGLEKSSWTKLFTISRETMGEAVRLIRIFPSGYSADGDIMLSFGDSIVLYNSKTNKFVYVLDFDVKDLRVHSYVESLISP